MRLKKRAGKKYSWQESVCQKRPKIFKGKKRPFFSLSVKIYYLFYCANFLDCFLYLEAFSSSRKRFFTARSCENWNGIFAGLYFYNFKSNWNFTFIAQKYHIKSMFACFFVICFMGIQRFKNCSLRLLQINKASVRLIILLWAYRGFPSSYWTDIYWAKVGQRAMNIKWSKKFIKIGSKTVVLYEYHLRMVRKEDQDEWLLHQFVDS